ncbi:MAG: phage holin family protein [Simkaniaceae bacterium]|nr:phage holin family protein [Simkaniaceae bacterium]
MWLFIVRILITALTIIGIAHVIPGLEVANYLDAAIFGLMLGLVNAFVRPLLILLTLPITIFTLGLFLLFINAFTFWLASEISYGVQIHTFAAAVWGGLIIWIMGIFTNRLVWNQY